ncbi:Glutamyl-tRNA(Gln) amidotransferase subunit A [Fusarium oxysporum f. sp. albedinis]|nr:Glutamyl-tRNA(Gln) amidotransferase subunit A [Fusarium oxysporum f. sp. albedinis]
MTLARWKKRKGAAHLPPPTPQVAFECLVKDLLIRFFSLPTLASASPSASVSVSQGYARWNSGQLQLRLSFSSGCVGTVVSSFVRRTSSHLRRCLRLAALWRVSSTCADTTHLTLLQRNAAQMPNSFCSHPLLGAVVCTCFELSME